MATTDTKSLLPRVMSLVVAPFVALVAFALFHQKGIGMVADGRALWEGAVNLFEGNGYRYFSGNPVIAWPPLYSFYLVPWIKFLGASGWSLLLSNGLLIVLQTFFWNAFFQRMARQSGILLSALQSFIMSLFLGLFIAIILRSVLSYNLLYVFLPLYLGVLWHCFRAKDSSIRPWDILWVGVLGTAMMLTHNASLAFVAAGSAVMAVTQAMVKRSLLWVILTQGSTLAVTLCAPLLIWHNVRDLFHQTGSHYVGLGAGKYTPLEYAYQLLWGPGRLLVFDKMMFNTIRTGVVATVLLLLAIFYLMHRDRRAPALRFATLFVSVSSAVLCLMFNVTWIYSGIAASTYIMFIPLILGPTAYITAISLKMRLATVFAFAFLVPQLYWAGRWTAGQYTSTLADLDFPRSFASPEAYISPMYRSGPPVITTKGILIPSSTEEEPRGRRM